MPKKTIAMLALAILAGCSADNDTTYQQLKGNWKLTSIKTPAGEERVTACDLEHAKMKFENKHVFLQEWGVDYENGGCTLWKDAQKTWKVKQDSLIVTGSIISKYKIKLADGILKTKLVILDDGNSRVIINDESQEMEYRYEQTE